MTNDTNNTNESSLPVVQEERMDLVPKVISRDFALKAGNSQKYLLEKCQEYDIALGDLNEMVELKDKYQTNFPTMLNLLDQGYNPSQMREFLEARENLTAVRVTDIRTSGLTASGPSLVNLVELHESFDEVPLESGFIMEMAEKIYSSVRSGNSRIKYIGQSISMVVDYAERRKIRDLDVALEFFTALKDSGRPWDDCDPAEECSAPPVEGLVDALQK